MPSFVTMVGDVGMHKPQVDEQLNWFRGYMRLQHCCRLDWSVGSVCASVAIQLTMASQTTEVVWKLADACRSCAFVLQDPVAAPSHLSLTCTLTTSYAQSLHRQEFLRKDLLGYILRVCSSHCAAHIVVAGTKTDLQASRGT